MHVFGAVGKYDRIKSARYNIMEIQSVSKIKYTVNPLKMYFENEKCTWEFYKSSNKLVLVLNLVSL